MYQYIYDSFLGQRQYAKVLAEIENRLTDLGIHGKVDRLSPLKSVAEAIDDGVRRGIKTVVAVGNDETLKKVIEVAPNYKVTVGVIPLGSPNRMARLLGIPDGSDACETLSARRAVTVDVGRVNGQYFLSSVSIPGGRVTLDCEGKYRVTPVGAGAVHICNLAAVGGRDLPTHISDPCDGFLDAVIEPAEGRFPWRKKSNKAPTILPLRRISVTSHKPFSALADGRQIRNSIMHLEILPLKLKIIAGKQRMF
ncbi:hypothetical protein A3F28_02845 [Candidatus Uhrbacteria bacterium RIFCSPHIGHO2_12_FULL_57_11]|uniref:DAGKc domain-containing protein n=2 Tax=Candidatus Uhriibacteriota TaxID=1752732 RepID=A0A1F7UL51_9BACT|nr:MAG: hypothetical protein A3D72_00835 [Candidatus Uhrbacteria bacterium RIFCSPHIGHO2_02_FULL_57_19]OGL78438.1 MAG: hypothetical protein A3F28_02845 [Candidatus Uhrbacteria bacterium RIFCSPHIGHO2_12_FULL_57_11]